MACAFRLLAIAIFTIAAALAAGAQDLSVSFGQGAGLTERAIQLIALITVLSLAPSILVMVTSFTRIVVVLSLLRTALGTATAPPNAVVVSLALFLTVFVMGLAFQRAYDLGVRPLSAGEISPEQAFERSSEPFRAFMLKNVREKDLSLFMDLSQQPRPDKPEDISMRVLTPPNMTLASIPTFRIAFEMLKRAAGVDMTFVPHPGNAPAVSALLGDDVTSVLAVYPTVAEQVKAGKLRAIVTTSQGRIEALPDLPTVAEAGYKDYSEEAWFGLVAPAKTPKEILTQVSAWFTTAMNAPEIELKLQSQGLYPVGVCGTDFATFLRSQYDTYGRAIREAISRRNKPAIRWRRSIDICCASPSARSPISAQYDI